MVLIMYHGGLQQNGKLKLMLKTAEAIFPSSLEQIKERCPMPPCLLFLPFLQICTQASSVINREDCPFEEERPYLEPICFHHY